MEVFNHDIVMIYDMTQRFIKEMQDSQSSGVSGLYNQHDMSRMKSYIDSLNALKGWVVAQPQLDLPELHPRQYDLEEPVEIINRESEVVNMLVNMLHAITIEMIHSASARLASGLVSHDGMRFDLLTTKMMNFLTDYVEEQTPLDLPESSPVEEITGPGRKGTIGK